MTAPDSFYGVFLALRTALKGKGVPFECVYGAQQVPDKVGATRIDFARDYEAGDQVGSPRSTHKNPGHPATRALAGRVRILAKSTKANATRGDHEQIADNVFDQVYVELHKIIVKANTTWRVQRATFLPDPTTDGWNAVVYEFRFSIDAPVVDVTWTGEAAAEATVGGAHGVAIATELDATGPDTSTDLPNATTRNP
jgi:hypothetical protein